MKLEYINNVLFLAIWHKYGEASFYVCKREKYTKLPRICKKHRINVLSKMHACLSNMDFFICTTQYKNARLPFRFRIKTEDRNPYYDQ